MSILDKLLDAFSTKAASVPLFSNVFGRTTLNFNNSRANAEYYKGWVYKCVNVTANEVAKIELILEKKDKQGNVEVIHDHPAITLLHYVNDFFTKYTLFERLQADLELFGNHYWLIVRDGKGVPIELYPLNPNCITPINDPELYVSGYRYKIDSENYTIPAENIIHFKNYNPSSFTVGLSTIEAIRTTVDTEEAAKAYGKQFFENNATPGVILEYPGSLNTDAMDKMREQWDSQYKGFKKAYRTAVAAGGLKIHPMEYKQGDMQFIEQRKFSRDEIFAMFGVPPTIAGINEATVYAAAKAAEYSFSKFTIEPKLVRIVDTLNEFFIKLFPDSDGLMFHHKSTVPYDVAEKTLYYQSGIGNGYLSPNDVRRAEGLAELEDGDNVYLPMNLVSFSKPVVKSIKEDPKKKAADEKRETVVKSMVSTLMKALEEEQAPALIAGKWEPKIFDRMGEQKAKGRNARTAAYEKVFEKTAQKLFDAQKKRVLSDLNNVKSHLKINSKLYQNAKYKFKVSDVFDIEKEIAITVDLFTPLFKTVTEEEGRQAMEAIGLSPEDFSIDTPSMQEFLKKNTKLFAGVVSQTTADGIRDVITAGLDAGEAIVDIRKRIQEYSGFDKARSVKIARTETIRAQGEAEIAAWKESKVVLETVWYTALDERTCPQCNDLHGEKIDTGAEFVTEAQLQDEGIEPYNGGINNPPAHPQCRCTLIPVVK